MIIYSIEELTAATGHEKNGLLLVDKPTGCSSFDLIRHLRKRLNMRKMGHAGTLDPQASGLMIVAFGSSTKNLEQLLGLPKSYRAEIFLGIQTDTGDKEGKILKQKKIWPVNIQKKEIIEMIESYVGTHELSVPMYSAIKVEGHPLYWYARKGISAPSIPTKVMHVYKSELLDQFEYKDGYIIRIEWSVSSGTYIRSLVEDIGTKLNIPAMLWNLRRTSVGEYRLHDPKIYTPKEIQTSITSKDITLLA